MREFANKVIVFLLYIDLYFGFLQIPEYEFEFMFGASIIDTHLLNKCIKP